MDALKCRDEVICALESVHRHGLCVCMWYAIRWNPEVVLPWPGCGQQVAGDAWALESRVLLLLDALGAWSLPLCCTHPHFLRGLLGALLTGPQRSPQVAGEKPQGSILCMGALRVCWESHSQPGTEPRLGRSDCYRLWWCLLPDALLHPKQNQRGFQPFSKAPLLYSVPRRT